VKNTSAAGSDKDRSLLRHPLTPAAMLLAAKDFKSAFLLSMAGEMQHFENTMPDWTSI